MLWQWSHLAQLGYYTACIGFLSLFVKHLWLIAQIIWFVHQLIQLDSSLQNTINGFMLENNWQMRTWTLIRVCICSFTRTSFVSSSSCEIAVILSALAGSWYSVIASAIGAHELNTLSLAVSSHFPLNPMEGAIRQYKYSRQPLTKIRYWNPPITWSGIRRQLAGDIPCRLLPYQPGHPTAGTRGSYILEHGVLRN